MSLVDTILSRLGRPAGRALDPTIRDLVQQVLKEHGYASPAEVQALRDEVRDMRARVDGMASRLEGLTKLADAARAEAATAREAAKAAQETAAAARAEAAAAQAEAERAEAAAAAAPASVPPPAAAPAEEAHVDCKVPDCSAPVRSKGFCSPHYQQWRRGTLKGYDEAPAS